MNGRGIAAAKLVVSGSALVLVIEPGIPPRNHSGAF